MLHLLLILDGIHSSFSFSVVASGALALVMGIRFKKSGKLMPAGIMAGLR